MIVPERVHDDWQPVASRLLRRLQAFASFENELARAIEETAGHQGVRR